MLSFDSDIQCWLASKPIDMRIAIDGLSVLVSEQLSQNPQSKSLYLFYNRSRDKIKGLLWDGNGFIMLYKRLERGRFKLPRPWPQTLLLMSYHELNWLLSGFDFYEMSKRPELKFQDYC